MMDRAGLIEAMRGSYPPGPPQHVLRKAASEIEGLQAALALSDRVIYRLELGGEPWGRELLDARDAAINRVRAQQGKAPLPGSAPDPFAPEVAS